MTFEGTRLDGVGFLSKPFIEGELNNLSNLNRERLSEYMHFHRERTFFV